MKYICVLLISLLAFHGGVAISDESDSATRVVYPVGGIDVSHFQGEIQWAEVSGIHFALVKATGGERFVDPQFARNWDGLANAGLLKGAYHFFYASDDPVKQAEHFLQTLETAGGMSELDFPPVLDIETLDGETREIMQEKITIWLEMVEITLGKKPVIYTGENFANANLDDPVLSKYPLWVADYNQVIEPPVPAHWHGWVLWQRAEDAAVIGVGAKVDFSVFNGDQDDLQSFIKKTTR